MNRAAVVYIGSRVLQFLAAELHGEEIRELDFVESMIDLGHQTFTTGRIQFETVEEIAQRINDFKRLAADYGIKEMELFATTALREAKNREFILDQLQVETGLEVSIFEDAEEKMYFYNRIVQMIEGNEGIQGQPALISYIGTGNIGVTYYNGDVINATQNVPLGTLRIREKVGDSLMESEGFATFMSEYMDNAVSLFKKSLTTDNIPNVVVAGKQTDLLSKAFSMDTDDAFVSIERAAFDALYAIVKKATPEQLVDQYNLSFQEAEILLPTLATFGKMMEISTTDRLIVLRLRFVDLLMKRVLNNRSHSKEMQHFYRHSIASSRMLGEQYGYTRKHAEMIEDLSLQIYEAMKKTHGLSKMDHLRLQLAAILHGIAGFEDTRQYHQIIYDMLRNFSVVGLRERDLLIVAETVYKFLHETEEDVFRSAHVTNKMKTKITKMAAILLLSEAVDQSRKQKMKNCQVTYKKGQLRITAETDSHYELEDWYFKRAASWFKDIFGVQPIFTVKRGYHEMDEWIEAIY